MKKEIRHATAEDLEFLYTELQQGLAEQHVLHRLKYSHDEFGTLLFGKQPIAEALILWVDNNPAGFAIYATDYRNFTANRGPTLYLNDLYVKKEYRQQGGATQLLKTLQAIAKQKDCGRIEWLIQPENKEALKFYKTFPTQNMNEVLDYIRLTID